MKVYTRKMQYCESIIIREVLIFVELVVGLKSRNLKSTKYNAYICLFRSRVDTRNSRTHKAMHFEETTKIGCHELKYIHSVQMYIVYIVIRAVVVVGFTSICAISAYHH